MELGFAEFGGLWEGGCVGGKRASGGEEEMVWWIGGAGVIAEAVERYLGRGCVCCGGDLGIGCRGAGGEAWLWETLPN